MPQDATRVYVGSVPHLAEETLFRAHFARFGVIRKVELFAERAFGFVTFERSEDAKRAVAESKQSFTYHAGGEVKEDTTCDVVVEVARSKSGGSRSKKVQL